MATTIKIQNETAELLKKEKEKRHVKSYDEVILGLFRKKGKKSMAGAFAKKKHYSREEILKDLRDKVDRF